jgi:ABC-type multidrug transport system permease subunit
MKVLDITIKDMLQASRSRTIFFFMFVIPIGISLLFMVMFRGIGDDDGFQLPTIDVVIVNLDEGKLPGQALDSVTGDAGAVREPFSSMGDVVVQLLRSDAFSALMHVELLEDVDSAKRAVDAQEAGVAVILPANFTDSLIQRGTSSSVELYKDPTLSFSPLIVEAIVSQILDRFSSASIATNVSVDSLASSGLIVDDSQAQELAMIFTAAFSEQGISGEDQQAALVAVQAPSGSGEETDLLTQIVGTIFGGMMIFFGFFTAASTLETILVEEERGTLARLFTTPTGHRAILEGKSLSAVVILIFQLAVLLTFGALAMNIYWGTIPTILLAAIGTILLAVATGSFLVSFMQNTRQGGIIFGGVLTMTGMLGLIPVFTSGNPDQPEALQFVSLLVPQGWAMRGLSLSMEGAPLQDMLPIFGVILLWTIVLASIGQYRLSKRFA